MARDIPSLFAFNRGLVSELALARMDIERVGLSAVEFQNFTPRTFGSMMFRPGLGYIEDLGTALVRVHEFIFATDDTALLVFGDGTFTPWVDEEQITFEAMTAAVTNGTFATDLTGWTDLDESGATSSWATGGYLSLVGDGFNAAIRQQEVTVVDLNEEHAIKIVIERGPVTVRVGSIGGEDDYVRQIDLPAGEHILSFTPTGNFVIRFFSYTKRLKLVDSCEVFSGVLELSAPYALADLSYLRFEQSADVVWIACRTPDTKYQQRKIIRSGLRSWSLGIYQPDDGPFRSENVDRISIAPDALSGNVTLTASQALFKSGHVGALFRVSSLGQRVEQDVTGEDEFTGHIRVVGVDASRSFRIVIAGTWSGATITLQRSISEPGAWADYLTYAANTNVAHDDGLDNQIIYYRIGVKTGDWAAPSGTIELSLEYEGGSIDGIARVTSVTSTLEAEAEVIQEFGGTDASTIWSEGTWSDARDYPSAVRLFEGRLWWFGADRMIGSISDAYENFDDEEEGDAAPIQRSIGRGPVQRINWVAGLQRLVLGTDAAELTARSSSFDEPLTRTNWALKAASRQGSAAIDMAEIDDECVFAQRSGTKLYETSYTDSKLDYASHDMTMIVPRLCASGIVHIAVQRQPETRVHVTLGDGTVAVLLFEKLENVRCWYLNVTDGEIQQTVVLPGTAEDQVYYVVRRSIEAMTHYYLERLAQETEAEGGLLNKVSDSFLVYQGASTVTLPCTHLVGETVVVWGDGEDMGEFVVSGGGTITLGSAVTSAVYGLPYEGRWRGTKLRFASVSPLMQKKRVDHIGILLGATHRQGVQYGRDFDNLDNLPTIIDGAVVTEDFTELDHVAFPFQGTWDTDSRVCLKAESPKHAAILGIAMTMAGHEKA